MLIINNKMRNRNEKTELLKYNASKVFATLNPFGTIAGKAFKIRLNDEIITTIETLIKQEKASGFLISSDIKEIYNVLNKSDTRDFMTVYSQELLKEKGAKKKESINLLAAIKLASVASTFPVRHGSAKKSLANISSKLESLAVKLATKHSAVFGKNLQKVFSNRDIFDAKQNTINGDIDVLRSFYWNKFVATSEVIADAVDKIKKIFDNEKELFVVIAKYQNLFNEYSAAINNKKSKTVADEVGFEQLSNQVVVYFKQIKNVVEKRKLKFAAPFLTHITESSEKVNLSDLPKLSISQGISLFVSYILLLAWSVVIIFPLMQMIILSFDGTRTNNLGETAGADAGAFIHYTNLWNKTDFKFWLGNSMEVAFITMALTVLLTVLLAYAFSRFNFKGKRSSIMSIMLLQMVPTIASLTAFLVLFRMLNEGIHINVLTFLIIIYTGGALTGNTFILKGYFDSIPKDLDEAAELDGASKMKTFRSILIPLAKPMIAIVALWSFIGPFGDVILPNLLNDGTLEARKHLTMAAGLRTLVVADGTGGSVFQFEYLAGAIVTSVPIAILFIAAQRFMVGGLTAGAVK